MIISYHMQGPPHHWGGFLGVGFCLAGDWNFDPPLKTYQEWLRHCDREGKYLGHPDNRYVNPAELAARMRADA